MSNPLNHGLVMGHAASEPKISPELRRRSNSKMAVFARNAFVNKTTGEVESEIVELTSYLPDANVRGVFGLIHTGDRVAISYSLKTDHFTTKDGIEQFQLVARIDSVQLIDSRAEPAARLRPGFKT